ncbi:MAG: universal stress protein [Chloroflexota bacterium]|nr:universal stress protein [Chloroflexota bacterium]
MIGHYQRIVVPVKGVPSDARVLEVVGQLVHRHPVTITLIYVVEVLQSMPLDAELPVEINKGEAVLRQAEHTARHGLGHKLERVSTELLQARSAGAAIVDEAIERGADAIIMAAVNHHRHGRTTMGETAGYILKNAPCEVLLLRQAPGASHGAEEQR